MSGFAIFTKTKLSSISNFRANSLWSLSYVNQSALNSNGSLGDIMIMWNDLKYKILNTIKGNYTISIQIKNENGNIWWLTVVYGPTRNSFRDFF